MGNGTEKACLAFQMQDVRGAWEHIKIEVVKDYGAYAYGHALHTWDDGGRYLARCQRCGGYILVQWSEYHGIGDGCDHYYTDFFPVSGAKEAEELDRLYDGFDIEQHFKKRYLMRTDLRLHWSR